MENTKWWGKTLRIIGIIFLGITAVATIMAGIGTTCVAVAAKNFGPNMAKIAPYSWLYIIFVVVTTAIGVYMVKALIDMIKKKQQAYKETIISLIFGIIIGIIHMAFSRSLRGSSMPTDGVVYITVITLILFGLFRIPGIWKELNLDNSKTTDTNHIAAAFSLFSSGIAILTAPYWGASSHTFVEGGTNWANAWPFQMNLAGTLLIITGFFALISPKLKKLYMKNHKKAHSANF